jgi:hypothetical protein
VCILIFSTTFVWNICHCKKNWARYDQKCILVFIWSTRYSCPILMKHEFSPQIFEKYLNIEFHENPSSRSRVVPCERTDRHDEAFRNFANAPKTQCFWGYVEIGDRSVLSCCWPHHIRLKHLKGNRKYDFFPDHLVITNARRILLATMPAETCTVLVHFITSSYTVLIQRLDMISALIIL